MKLDTPPHTQLYHISEVPSGSALSHGLIAHFIPCTLSYKSFSTLALSGHTVPVPGGGYRQTVVVVDGDLLPDTDLPHRQQGHHQAEPGVVHPPPPGVGPEGVVGLVGQSGAVLVRPPHVVRDVQVQTRVEVDLVVGPLVLETGAAPRPVEDGDQVPGREVGPGEETLPGRLGGGEPHLHPLVLQAVRLQGSAGDPVLCNQ